MSVRPSARWTAVVALVAVAGIAVVLPRLASAGVEPGSAGVDTSLPLTDSKVVVSGRDRFSSLRITVNQTRNLVNQALSVTWTGGTPTTDYGGGTGTIGEHFLQMFQCWGDDDGTHPDNPGPPPEQCQQGATNGVFGGSATGQRFQGNTLTRVVSQKGSPGYDPSLGAEDEFGGVSRAFRAVDGTVVPQWRDTSFNPQASGGSYWLNPFFNIVTTNEIPGAVTSARGTGAELFEATTGLESTGLGCGQRVQPVAGGGTRIPRCWLVVVPRGDHTAENEGANVSPLFGVATSPLSPRAWANRIAVPLEFNPVETSCPLSAQQRRIVGSELLAAAVASWQPALCAKPGLSPYAYGSISDSRARAQLVSGTPGAPGMAVVSRPLDGATVDPREPVVYAPLTVSGTVIGFNLERLPRVIFPAGQQPSAEVLAQERALSGIRVAQLNLTPRLVAKLLTQSYRTQVEIAASNPGYAWASANPQQVGVDEDFLRFNPELRLLRTDSKNMGGFVAPSPGSDAAKALWEWVLADPEARQWLAGAPDPWGMRVNPYFTTSAAQNPQGAAFGDPVPDTYPKSDPYCYQGPPVGSLKVVPPPLCGLDWLPYAGSLRDAARAARAATDGARTEVNQSAASSDQVYKRDQPQALGQRAILAVTDTPSAAQYGLQTARLSRAGDDGEERRFIAADEAGLAAGARSLVERGVPGFLEPDPAHAPEGAYPLTAITYAAVQPTRLDDPGRVEYAAFVDYAAGEGQVRGFDYGKLPAGYEPLAAPLRAQAVGAAQRIRTLKAAEEVVDAAPPGPGSPAPRRGDAGPRGARGGLAADQAQPSAAPGPSIATPQPAPSETPVNTVLAGVTPAYRLAASRFALPFLVVITVLAALGALEVTKRPRRRIIEPADRDAERVAP